MKIAIDARWINHSAKHGIFVYSERLIYGLAGIDTNNEYFLLFTSLRKKPGEMPGPNQSNFTKSVLPLPDKSFLGRDFLFNRCFMPFVLKKDKFDIYHSLAGYSLPSSNRTKKILTIHDLRSLKIPDKTFPQDIASLKIAAHSADICITVSECTKKDVVDYLEIEADKVKVIYNGVDEIYRPLEKKPEYIKEKFGIKKRFFFSLGLVPRKNLERLIKAFNIFKYKDDFLLVIGGGENSGVWMKKYYELIRNFGLEENIRLIGHIPYEDLPLFYNYSECFIFPSLYEGFGIPIVEAMKCGVPVLTSNVSSLPEIGRDAVLYVDPLNVEDIAAKMERVINDRSLREELIEKGFKRAADFSWKRMTEETLKIYEGLLR